jgi:hypothetical protein
MLENEEVLYRSGLAVIYWVEAARSVSYRKCDGGINRQYILSRPWQLEPSVFWWRWLGAYDYDVFAN